MFERLDEHHAEAGRWILCPGPSSRHHDLVFRRVKRAQVGLMTTAGLIHHGIELEVNLIHPARKVDDERSAINGG